MTIATVMEMSQVLFNKHWESIFQESCRRLVAAAGYPITTLLLSTHIYTGAKEAKV